MQTPHTVREQNLGPPLWEASMNVNHCDKSEVFFSKSSHSPMEIELHPERLDYISLSMMESGCPDNILLQTEYERMIYNQPHVVMYRNKMCNQLK